MVQREHEWVRWSNRFFFANPQTLPKFYRKFMTSPGGRLYLAVLFETKVEKVEEKSMRELLVKTLATVSLVIAAMFATGVQAQAQSLANAVRVNIPFEFVVGDKTFPAGVYSFQRAQPSSGDAMLALRNASGKTQLVRLTNSVQSLDAKSLATLVFHRYGNQHFLSQVWPAASSTGRELAPSRAERELEREAKANQVGMRTSPADTITVTITVGR